MVILVTYCDKSTKSHYIASQYWAIPEIPLDQIIKKIKMFDSEIINGVLSFQKAFTIYFTKYKKIK